MASLLENLIDVLGRETQEYETLVTFAEQKPLHCQGGYRKPEENHGGRTGSRRQNPENGEAKK